MEYCNIGVALLYYSYDKSKIISKYHQLKIMDALRYQRGKFTESDSTVSA